MPSPFQTSNQREFRRKALQYLALFLALAVVYSVYIKTFYDRSCPASAEITVIDSKFLLTILKLFLVAGWPIVVVACLDTTRRGLFSYDSRLQILLDRAVDF